MGDVTASGKPAGRSSAIFDPATSDLLADLLLFIALLCFGLFAVSYFFLDEDKSIADAMMEGAATVAISVPEIAVPSVSMPSISMPALPVAPSIPFSLPVLKNAIAHALDMGAASDYLYFRYPYVVRLTYGVWH